MTKYHLAPLDSITAASQPIAPINLSNTSIPTETHLLHDSTYRQPEIVVHASRLQPINSACILCDPGEFDLRGRLKAEFRVRKLSREIAALEERNAAQIEKQHGNGEADLRGRLKAEFRVRKLSRENSLLQERTAEQKRKSDEELQHYNARSLNAIWTLGLSLSKLFDRVRPIQLLFAQSLIIAPFTAEEDRPHLALSRIADSHLGILTRLRHLNVHRTTAISAAALLVAPTMPHGSLAR